MVLTVSDDISLNPTQKHYRVRVRVVFPPRQASSSLGTRRLSHFHDLPKPPSTCPKPTGPHHDRFNSQSNAIVDKSNDAPPVYEPCLKALHPQSRTCSLSVR